MMAMGLGEMLGFRIPQKLSASVYKSTSVTDFWRRWHMTLSGWFKELCLYSSRRQPSRQSQNAVQYVCGLVFDRVGGMAPDGTFYSVGHVLFLPC